uniref:Acylphosphatase-like domain-containing protein n=1 Tax=Helicotheca tamesis TaxID=374047 RepID=A0A7S2HY23_9STRA|mmetsp:Transcript_3819/g.5139  ORF Transcript_3819/g.5139 Transcript_3819/m.5139 type:complete len:160 (+) Transcript_3819:222-701(+)|eukprot:CAMPEP_0185723146 /NCGR_PEP_ID=MMETSP1171-20130828/82_1 /TAXON_ID=374046 /ORGANISM="Helicotheca tamensis, Strain CCMP826" /LENGTH=159 /DNA_ID=CAMNT_0028390811 /DNA_START=183 /DNA_END=662 /DNA_ORIENTATION=+
MMRTLYVMAVAAVAAILLAAIPSANAFTVGEPSATRSISFHRSRVHRMAENADAAAVDPNEIVGRRIVVTGDVQGGYYRSCVANEAGRFRRLQGTMTAPDDTKEAEIYVEGKRKMVDGFVRWCKKGDVGLSQQISVKDVFEEVPTGLYGTFTVDTGREH